MMVRGGKPGRPGFPLALFGALVIAMAVVCGCGAGHQRRSTNTKSASAIGPDQVVARVGPDVITAAMLGRQVVAERDSDGSGVRLLPPSFRACVDQREAQVARRDGAAQRARFETECRGRYRALQRRALQRLISAEWLIGGARELGVATGAAEGERQTRGLVPAAISGRAAQSIRSAVEARAGPLSQSQVSGYYAQHKYLYVSGEQEREVYIAKTAAKVTAMRVEHEIAAGRSFAQVVKESGVAQADYSDEGLVLELRPREYGEPRLNRAIFSAKPGVLTGPVSTSFGYFVFKVRGVSAAHYKPLAAVEAIIRRGLRRNRRLQALERFARRLSARWTARTSCRRGYEVPGCRQAGGSITAVMELLAEPG